MKPKELLTLLVKDTAAAQAFLAEDGLKETIERIAYLETLDYTSKEAHAGANFIAGTEQYYLLFEIKVDIEAERKKIKEELKRLQGNVIGIEKKLTNEKFVSNAPAKVIEKERKKLADNQAKVALLQENLAKIQ